MAWAFTRILQQEVIPNTYRVRRLSFSPRFLLSLSEPECFLQYYRNQTIIYNYNYKYTRSL